MITTAKSNEVSENFPTLTLGKPLHGANFGSTLRYCGKQLYKTLLFMVYTHAFFLTAEFAIFVTYQIHPDWEARYEAALEAKLDADEEAYRAKRLEAERKAGLMGAQHASHAK